MWNHWHVNNGTFYLERWPLALVDHIMPYHFAEVMKALSSAELDAPKEGDRPLFYTPLIRKHTTCTGQYALELVTAG